MINQSNFTENYISCFVYFVFICLRKANILSHKSLSLFKVLPVRVGKQESTYKKKLAVFAKSNVCLRLYEETG